MERRHELKFENDGYLFVGSKGPAITLKGFMLAHKNGFWLCQFRSEEDLFVGKSDILTTHIDGDLPLNRHYQSSRPETRERQQKLRLLMSWNIASKRLLDKLFWMRRKAQICRLHSFEKSKISQLIYVKKPTVMEGTEISR